MSLPGDSFWVTPGRLLAGPYPGSATDVGAAAKLDAFLDIGVTRFIDLTEEEEGPPLCPYAPLLLQLAGARRIAVAHRRMPIPDLAVPSPPHMRSILAAIDEALADEQMVYVHCWGGVGRTGTVIACHLVESLDLTGADALAQLAKLRAGTDRAQRIAPETAEQRAFVTAWTRTPTRQAQAHPDCREGAR